MAFWAKTRSPRCSAFRRDFVDERTDWLDSDANLISSLQCERVRRYDACSGHQEGSIRKAVIAEEIFGKSRGLAFHLGQRSGTSEFRLAAAQNLQLDGRG